MLRLLPLLALLLSGCAPGCGTEGVAEAIPGRPFGPNHFVGDLASGGGGGGPAFVARTVGTLNRSGNASFTITLSATATAGNTLVLVDADGIAAVSGVTGGGAGWTSRATLNGGYALWSAWSTVVASNTGTVDVTMATANYYSNFWSVFEYSGLAGSFDVSATQNAGYGATATPGSITPGQTGSYHGLLYTGASPTYTGPGALTSTLIGSTSYYSAIDGLVSSGTPYNPTHSQSSSGYEGIGITMY